MSFIEDNESKLPVVIDRIVENLGRDTSEDPGTKEFVPFENTIVAFIPFDRRGYPKDKTYIESNFDRTFNPRGVWGRFYEDPGPLFPKHSAHLYVEVIGGTRMIVVHPGFGYKLQIAQRVVVNERAVIYQWEPEDSKRMKGLIEVERNPFGVLGLGGEVNLGGLVKLTNEETSEEKIYLVDVDIAGSRVEAKVRELPEDPAKVLPPGK